MIDQETIEVAAQRIAPFIHRTPTIEHRLNNSTGAKVLLKLELMQKSGSFKARGAFNSLLSNKVPESGVIAASGGNHGAAVAYAARELGHFAETFVPTVSSPNKVARLHSYGATVTQIGKEFAETLEACLARQAVTGALSVHAYDETATLAGQGTLAKELEEQAPRPIDTAFIAVGGGGLIGGTLSWFRDRVNVIAVEPENAPTLNNALAEGQPVKVPVSGLAADSLGARQIGDLGFAAAQAYLHDRFLVNDEDIKAAQLYLWENFRVTAEPGGAAALVPLLTGQYQPHKDETVAVVICGGNVDLQTLIG